jgi:signal transduction histidine kinase
LRGIHEDKNENLYVSGYRGLDKLSKDKNSIHTLSDNIIAMTMCDDPRNSDKLILATEDSGLFALNTHTNRLTQLKINYTSRKNVYKDRFFKVIPKTDSTILVSNTAGAYEYNLNSFEAEYFNLDDKISGDYYITFDIHVDNKDRIWLATERSGLIMLDIKNQDTIVYSPNTIDYNYRIKSIAVNDIYQIGSLIYIGTNSGVDIIDSKTLEVVSNRISNLLDDERVVGIAHRKNNVWFSTFHNLFKLDTLTNHITEFSTKDGLPSSEFNRFSSCIGKDGTIYFGSINGLIYFNEERSMDTTVPYAYFSKYYEYNKPVILDTVVEYKKEILIDKDVNMFAFDVDYIYHTSNKNYISMQYMLEGHDKNWMPLESKIQYNSIKQGRYKLKVQVLLNGVVVSEISKTIIVKTDFFKTAGFRYLIFIIVFVLVLAFFLQSWIRERRYTKLLERSVTNKTKELKSKNEELESSNHMKNQLLSIVSHDIKSPLAIVFSSLQLIVDNFDMMNKDQTVSLLKSAQQNTQQLMLLQEDLFKWARSMMDKYNPNVDTLNLYMLTSFTIKLHENNAAAKQIKILNNVGMDAVAFSDNNIISTVLRNLLSNAIKFTDYGGEIAIHSENVKSGIKISIIDNGIGIEPTILEAIENRQKIKSQKGTTGEKGTGLGLTMCIDLLNLINIKLNAVNNPDKGSTMFFILPEINRD